MYLIILLALFAVVMEQSASNYHQHCAIDSVHICEHNTRTMPV